MAEFFAWLIVFIMWFAFWAGIATGIGFLMTGMLDGWFLGLLVAFWTSPIIMEDDL